MGGEATHENFCKAAGLAPSRHAGGACLPDLPCRGACRRRGTNFASLRRVGHVRWSVGVALPRPAARDSASTATAPTTATAEQSSAAAYDGAWIDAA